MFEESLKGYLRTIPNFENAYNRAIEYVRSRIDSSCESLELSQDSNLNMCFPLTNDNLYILGLDEKHLTIWIFFDVNLSDAT